MVYSKQVPVFVTKFPSAFGTNKPVNFVSFYDALRFCNWIHNGQAEGGQDVSTTEIGAYMLTGGATVVDCVPGQEPPQVHCPDAGVWIPTEDEWYKACYYKGGEPDTGYWDFCTQSDSFPVSEPPPGCPASPGSANYGTYDGGLACGTPYCPHEDCPYCLTDVGAYLFSPSPYGTFDQNGNVWEWTAEPSPDGTQRYRRGGWYGRYEFEMPACVRYNVGATLSDINSV